MPIKPIEMRESERERWRGIDKGGGDKEGEEEISHPGISKA
jgi:hypothetical protein